MKKILFLIIFFSFNLFSREVNYFARSPRALLMGDAFTALADDEFTLFYNPAAMGRNDGISITPFSPGFGFNDPLTGIKKFSNLPTATTDLAKTFMNYPIYLQAAVVPTVKMSHFGLSLFFNNQTSMVLRNATHPMLDLRYAYDRGFIMGFAYNMGVGGGTVKGKKGAKDQTSSGEHLSIGFGLKNVNRQGIDGTFDLFGTKLLAAVNGGASAAGIKSALGYSAGHSWGYDLGAEYVNSTGASTFTAGYSLMDIGGTRFDKTYGVADVPVQKMSANAGVAFKQDFGFFDYALTADLHPLLGPVDFMRQTHLGARFNIPFLTTIYAGLSEGYVSYGAEFGLGPLIFTAGWYGVETGAKFRSQEARRFILFISLFDFSIDL